MRAIIIAGGSGTRLRPLTYHTPKPMVPLFGKPFLQYQIELLRDHGIREIVINLHYLSETIRNQLGDGSELGVKLFYSLESKALGTAGAVKNAEQFFDDEPMLIFNGDILTDVDLSAVLATHRRTGARATLSLFRVEDPTAFGLAVVSEERITRFVEKPTMDEARALNVDTVNAGIYVLDPDVFRYVPQNESYSFERGLFPLLLQLEERISAHVMEAYWLDIGSPQKYLQAHIDALQGKVKLNIPGAQARPGVWVGDGVDLDDRADLRGPLFIGEGSRVRPKARLQEYSVLGPRCIVEDRALVERSIVGADSVIGEEAVLHNCLVGQRCRLGAHATLAHQTVLADDSVIGEGTRGF